MQTTKAFSLIELMIVVVIMGLVYSMVNMSFMKRSIASESLGPKTLAKFLRSFTDVPSRQFMIYGDNCDKALFEPPLETMSVESLSFSKEILVYESDAFGSYSEKEYPPLRIEDRDFKVCFKIQKYANGGVSALLFKNREHYYYIDPYFGDTLQFSTLEAAIKALQKNELNPTYLGLRRE